jgi:hypothetical protein
MPPPVRPNTSMGFNRDADRDTDDIVLVNLQSADDLSLRSESSSGAKNPSASGAGTLGGSLGIGSSKAGPSGLSQKPVSSLFNGTRVQGAARLHSGTGPIMRGVGARNLRGSRPIFGTGGGMFGGTGRAGAFQKVSRKTSLPSVMASPVKGAGTADSTSSTGDDMDGILDGNGQSSDRDQDVFTGPASAAIATPSLENPDNGKGKGKERLLDTRRNLASRRVSLASQALSQSLNSLPPSRESGAGSMGPPATPVGRIGTRSASSSYPSTSLPSSTGKASDGGPTSNTRSAMGLRSAPGALGKAKRGLDGHVSSSRKQTEDTGGVASKSIPESLKVLKDCVIFVDVRTDDGDEAGSLFVEMLEGVGARVSDLHGLT